MEVVVAASESPIFSAFKEKIEDAIALVRAMDADEKLKAVQYWNVVSKRLQDIVNNSVEDFTFQMEGEKLSDYVDVTQLVSLGLAPAFVTKYISNSGEAANKTYKQVNGHLILTDGIVQNNNLHTVLKVKPGIEDHQMSLEEVDMGAQETVVECVNNTETERLAEEEISSDTQSKTVIEEDVDEEDDTKEGCDENTVYLMITANSKTPPSAKEPILDLVPQKMKKEGEDGQKVGSEDAYECAFCQRTFSKLSQLTAHSWKHTKPYSCTDCDAKFSAKGNLIVHRRSHSGEKPYTCTNCDAKFSTKGNMKRHLKSHSGEKPWHCTQCGSSFTEKKSLKVHMRRHTGERPYQCAVCFKSFSQTSILQSHMAMHLNQRAHLCNQCGKSFRQKSQLRLHEQRHAGLRKYQCSFCTFKFLTKGDMERHKRVHTGERPFTCQECGKNFTRQQSLNEHMNRHWGLKPYKCKYCRKGFVEMSACYKHIKKHEKEKSDNDEPEMHMEVVNENKITAPSTETV